jgi:hypothetical protein
VGLLAETESGPEGWCAEGDVAPVSADMGCSELEKSGWDGVVVLVWLEEERREIVRVVILCTEDKESCEELDGEGVDGREKKHCREAGK